MSTAHRWLLTLTVAALCAAPRHASAVAGGAAPATHPDASTYLRADHSVVPAALRAALEKRARIPSFSRQTHLACSACHYQFPQLTPFGRLFKLNAYTLTALTTIGSAPGPSSDETLKLAPIPPASAMVVTSLTRTNRAIAGTQNDAASFPQQFSLFLAGQVTPNVGAFTQFTYADADGAIGIDNVDLRYARHFALGMRDVVVGLTLHNNPTVQDVWNTAPAWSWPFMSASAAPAPAAGTLLEGALGQQVVGLGAYGLWAGTLYTEITAYRSAPQGGPRPLDSTAANTIRQAMPYWRVALQHGFSSFYGMVGAFGMAGELYPTGVSGSTNRFTDVGTDAQLERPFAQGAVIGRASWIHERRRLDAFTAASPSLAEMAKGTLDSFRSSISVLPDLRYGLTLGYFHIGGSADTLLYAAEPVDGSRTGTPNSTGALGEVVYNPWQNTRVGLQYVAYTRFNGAARAYDVADGRRASDNDTLYLFAWIAF